MPSSLFNIREKHSVYCVVVTHNGAKWIDKCLQSVLHSTIDLKVICIDNNSSDSTAFLIQTNYPHVLLICNEMNDGFGKANNLGIRLAIDGGADYVFLLNQDAFIEPDTISNLVQLQLYNHSFGILSPLHLNGAGNNYDHNFLKYLAESRINTFTQTFDVDQIPETDLLDVGFINAAAWLLNFDCIKITGGFDPIFFHYGEDRNYAQRAIHHGFRIGISTKDVVYHDRETLTLTSNKNPIAHFNKVWLQFLIKACDINNKHYFFFIAKTLLQHTISYLKSKSLKKNAEANFHHALNRKIIAVLKNVKISRQMSVSQDVFIHL